MSNQTNKSTYSTIQITVIIEEHVIITKKGKRGEYYLWWGNEFSIFKVL